LSETTGKVRFLDVSAQSAPVYHGAEAKGEFPPLETLIIEALEDDKAEDITFIDLSGKSSIADAMIIASGRSARHVSALADHLVRKLKEEGFGRAQVEGMANADWVLIDAGDVVVHLFRPEVREFYQLERIWAGSSHITDAH
tara:strand:+ start:20855 stop:21280 length:426 start_codon:yes stop_codon:yes gene_type:complete